MGSNENENKIINEEDVITKLKDDGDFDRLRLKIVRQLKLNEDLRNNIISVVKQSTALNRPDVENMKPRQLCDEIYAEIREKAMSQISDGLWEIIRSDDGMKLEIKETVESVYNKLLNPQQKVDGESMVSNGPVMDARESNGTTSNGEHKEALASHIIVEEGRELQEGNDPLEKKSGDSSPPPPGFSSTGSDAHDEDPDIPPGFG